MNNRFLNRSLSVAAVLLVVGAAMGACSDDDGRSSTSTSTSSGGDEGGAGGGTTSSTTAGQGGAGGGTGTGGAGQGGAGVGGGTGGGGTGGAGVGGGSMAAGDCTNPVMAADPTKGLMGDTTGHKSSGDGSCESFDQAADVVYEVTPAMDGMLDVTITSDADLGIHVRTTCGDDTSEIGCADENFFPGDSENVSVPVKTGSPVYVFVDGYDNTQEGTFMLDIASRPIACNDGHLDPSEECDPPDNVTCDANCKLIPEAGHCSDGMDNDSDGFIDCEDAEDCGADAACPLATQCGMAEVITMMSTAGDTTGGTTNFAGSCTGDELVNEKIYQYTPAMNGILSLTLSSASDLGFYVRTACADAATELNCTDLQAGGSDETGSVPVAQNVPIWIFVDGYTTGEAGPFTLQQTLTPSTEVEPNDTSATANTYAMGFIGTILPSAENDYVKFTVPGPMSSVDIETIDLGDGSCMNNYIDSYIEVYDTDGTTSLGTDEDSGDGYCSFLTLTNLAAGTYYVRVTSSDLSPGAVFGYGLKITVTP